MHHDRHSAATDEVFRSAVRFEGGLLVPGEEPGLGVVYDDDVAAGHPYAAAYLPINRLSDGSVHDW